MPDPELSKGIAGPGALSFASPAVYLGHVSSRQTSPDGEARAMVNHRVII